MAQIAAGAQVSADARLAEDVAVGPGAVIEGGCEIGPGSEIGAYSIIWRGTRVGRNNRIFPFCSLGGEPQDKKFRGEESALVVGDGNVIREYCFFNRGTKGGGGETRIGNGNWIMAYVHAAHDCCLEDGIVAANGAQFAGHVFVGGGAVIGGGALFHQFRRIGAGAMVGGGERVRQDVPPYALAAGGLVGVNAEGMRRAGLGKRAVLRMKEAFRILYRSGLPLSSAREKIKTMSAAEEDAAAAGALKKLAGFLALENLELIRPGR